MRSKEFQDMLGNIDDDLVVAADVRVVPMKRKHTMKLVSGIAAACFLAVCAVLVLPLLNRTVPKEKPAEAGGLNGKINVQKKIKVEGTDFEFSDGEGFAYLESVSEGIQNTLKAVGVKTENFRISKFGYAHVRTGNDGNSMAVNWKDYVAYSGDEIVAIITLMKDESGFHDYPAWGAPCFAEYGEFLTKHKGTELVYIYAGDVDAVLTPDGQIYSFGTDISRAVSEKESEQYYSFFKMDQNTYVPD